MKLNVMDFGAVGDGRTDDSAAFQAAVDSAPSSVIYVPPGAYRLADAIGMSGTKQISFVADFPASAHLIVDHAHPFAIDFDLVGSTNCGVANLSFSCASPTTTMIRAVHSETFRVNGIAGYVNGGIIDVGDGCNFQFFDNIRFDCQGGCSPIRVRYGGGVWSNIFIRKTTVHSRVGPCVHVTGQSTSLQVTNCSIGGVGAGYSYPISQITSNGTSFTVTAPGHSFVLGKLICIRGAWGYDGVWQITSLGINSFTVTSNINLGMVHPSSASASDLACSLLLDNATLPVNEHSWSNILFEGIEAPNTGSVAVMLDATRSDYTLAQHSFNNVFLDSGKDIGFYAVGKYVSTIPNIQGLTLNGVRGHGTLNGIRLHDASAVLMNAVRVDRVGSDPNAAALVLEQWAPGTMRRVKVAGSLIGAGSVSGLDFPTAIKGRGSLAEIFIPAADVVGSVSGVELSQQLPPYTVSA